MTEELQQAPQEQAMSPAPKQNWLMMIGGIAVGAVVVGGVWLTLTILQPETPEVNETPVTGVEPTESTDTYRTEKIYSLDDANKLSALNFNINAAEFFINDYRFLTQITENEEGDYLNFELIRIDGAYNETLIYQGIRSPGHEATWEYKDGYFTFTHQDSPGEAFVNLTKIIFNEKGEEVLRTRYKIPGEVISLQKNDASYSVKLATSGSCTNDDVIYKDDQLTIPEVTLIGLELWTEELGPTVELPEPVTIPCGVIYGENISEPHISVKEFNQDGMLIELPDGTRAWISIENDVISAAWQ